jgi:mannose-1-phosphate guanylyltransferase/mannose-6-phosphate isomerase
MSNLTPVILCGGSGSRLWPLSRADYPKQFIKFNNDNTLFQKTLIRINLLAKNNLSVDEILILTNESHRFIVLEQLKTIKTDIKIKIILEPASLNTAPALTLAAAAASPESTLVVIPSDQFIESDEIFVKRIHDSIKLMKHNAIFIFGIKPRYPECEYGYILCKGRGQVKEVVEFIEKPEVITAKKIIENKYSFWNMGIFVLSSTTWLNAISKTNKSVFNNVVRSWDENNVDNIFIRPSRKIYLKAASISIDHAVIEKAVSIGIDLKVLEMKTGWSDLGQHKSLEILYKRDKNQNIIEGNVIEKDTKNTTVIGTYKQISLLGVKDLIVIDTEDSLLIVDKNSSSSMRGLINKISENNKSILDQHSIVHRPWGRYEVICEQKYCKIKKIIVNPNSQLSYQSHKHRSEHWIVLEGIATIIKNGKTFKLSKDESTYISCGDKHKLINNEKKLLEIIEVQTGKKLSEEDIVRYNDSYGRLNNLE